jgi:hypothetical protein
MSRFVRNINEQEANNSRHLNVFQSYNELEFDVKAFLKDGKTEDYVLYASDGRPFLVKYSKPLIKKGKLYGLNIWLIDPRVSKKDIVCSSYVSETYSHFFGRDRDASEDYLGIDDGGLVVAEIALEAEENGILFLIDDLNYKHITESVLNKYYGSYRGQYDYIGRSMVGIAGRVLMEVYGIAFLGVKTDKTKGFYWEISGHPPKNPVIPSITIQLEHIKDIKARKEIRESFYMTIVKSIILRRFDPYLSIGCDIGLEDAWMCHCSEIRSIFSNNKSFLSRLLEESGDAAIAGGVDEFIDQILIDYKVKNIEWFNSINGRMRRLIKVWRAGAEKESARIIDEIISIEEDPIVKKVRDSLKQMEITTNNVTMIYEALGQYSRIFPIFDLRRMDELKIGIRLHKEGLACRHCIVVAMP